MPDSSTLLRFALAVLSASLLATLFQTQYNLAGLQALGVPVPLDIRLRTTAQDLLGFTPTMAALIAAGFLFALPAAAWLARRLPLPGWALFAVAGAVSVWGALELANALAPMPTLVAANRTLPGTLGLMSCGAVGGLLFIARERRP